jgi:hypothetical protein
MMGYAIYGHFASQFPGRMSSHAVGNHEEMAILFPSVLALRQLDRCRILIIRPAHTQIGDHRIVNGDLPIRFVFAGVCGR